MSWGQKLPLLEAACTKVKPMSGILNILALCNNKMLLKRKTIFQYCSHWSYTVFL